MLVKMARAVVFLALLAVGALSCGASARMPPLAQVCERLVVKVASINRGTTISVAGYYSVESRAVLKYERL